MLVPIRCSLNQVDLLWDGLGCTVGNFPCRYLGLPLCLRKPTAVQFQKIVDGFAKKLPSWRAASMDKAGCLALALPVLCAMHIYAMITLDVPSKVITSMIKICKDSHGLGVQTREVDSVRWLGAPCVLQSGRVD